MINFPYVVTAIRPSTESDIENHVVIDDEYFVILACQPAKAHEIGAIEHEMRAQFKGATIMITIPAVQELLDTDIEKKALETELEQAGLKYQKDDDPDCPLWRAINWRKYYMVGVPGGAA